MRRELINLNLPHAGRAKKKLGRKINDARKALELKWPEVSAKTGVSMRQLDHIQAGRYFPSVSVLIALCRVLKLDVDLKEL